MIASQADTPRRIGYLWGLCVLLQAPLFAFGPSPVLGFWQAVGYAGVGAGVAAAFLYAGRGKADRGMRAATIAMLVWSALAWANAFSG